MARTNDNKKTENVLFNIEIPVHAASVPMLVGLMVVPEGQEAPPDSKVISLLCSQYLTELAEGGLMLTGGEVERIRQATGIDPESGEDLLPYISEGAGMQEGSTVVKVAIDPAYISSYEEIAKSQGREVSELIQETVDMVMANEWVYECSPRPEVMLMTPQDKKDLEDILGAKFANGTELANLIRQATGAELAFAAEAATAEDEA